MINRNRIITGIAALLLLIAAPLLAACGGDGDAGTDRLTRADVDEIVDVAIATLPAPAAAPADPRRKSDPAAYTRFVVDRAIDMYESEGLIATLGHYNDEDSTDGEWYMFIIDGDNVMRAHAANAALVDRPVSEAVGPNNYPAGEVVAASASEAGAWSEYTFANPAPGGADTKHSWLGRYDGLIFGSGWYEPGPAKADGPAYTQAFVQGAINLYNALGRDAAIAYYNSRESVDDEWYVFIVGAEDGVTISHDNPDFIGRDPSPRIDATGHFYGDDLLAAAASGRWVDYVLVSPATGDDGQKHTWAVLHDGLIFGSGWY